MADENRESGKCFDEGEEFRRKGLFEKAIECFDEAIRLNPNLTFAYNDRGSAKNSLGRYEEAIKDFDEAIRLDSNFAMAYNNRGATKDNLGKFEDGIKDFDEAIRLNSRFANAFNNRGYAKDCLGKFEEGIKDFDEAIQLNPNFAIAYNNRGFAKNKLGRYEEAIRDYEVVTRLDPDNASAFSNRGFAKNSLGRYGEAINDFDEAINLNPSYAVSFFGRAMVFDKFFQTSGNKNDRENNRKLAERDFKSFLKLADDSLADQKKYAETALERLKGPRVFHETVNDSVQLKDKADSEVPSSATENAQLEAAKATQTVFDLLRTYPEVESKTEAVMFVDICGSTGFLTEWGIKEYLKRVFILEEVVIACNPLFKKGMGDGFMMVYKERKDAVLAAFKIMKMLKEKNSGIENGKKIAVRIGISSGQTEIRSDGDRYGAAVIVAARLESFKEDVNWKNFKPEEGANLPKTDRILASYNIIRDPAFPKDNCSWSYIGDAELNGFEETRQKIHLLKSN